VWTLPPRNGVRGEQKPQPELGQESGESFTCFATPARIGKGTERTPHALFLVRLEGNNVRGGVSTAQKGHPFEGGSPASAETMAETLVTRPP
jgi:hypothetical protein